jgi:hypothetical protein
MKLKFSYFVGPKAEYDFPYQIAIPQAFFTTRLPTCAPGTYVAQNVR